ncbi:uncharacterized protein LY89DRAFT_778872 [Mollisia scopiformis]|uniref:Zn(2)-C6 fungal-type domain-containing protein n=1 Tax=Mollisia scopiformis TaxID=149040 RepID=A0A194XNH3_MOLSC|nr:uncharacterized protein LY89DRAFT_778872 [Mollisia scopiformis]KUJ21302.1 hypothetical protein LY89DRAFT_778872 [Mollisia scopiformis]
MDGTFTFFALGGEKPIDLKVDAKGDPVRKRQQHRKSRNGCGNCKRRKVKCDESQPSCLNCRKRGLECSVVGGNRVRTKSPEREVTMKDASQQCDLSPEVPYQQSFLSPDSASLSSVPSQQGIFGPESNSQSPLPPGDPSQQDIFAPTTSPTQYFLSSKQVWCRTALHPETIAELVSQYGEWGNVKKTDSVATSPVSSIPGNVDLILRRSLAERELILHFELFTSKCLPMSSTIWESEVLNDALHHDYLMSAVLLMAACHINHYLPKDDLSRRPLLHHFGNAISGLRMALQEELTPTSFNNIISCSFLLMLYSWTYIEAAPGVPVEVVEMFHDPVTLFYCLKDCIVSSQFLLSKTSWSRVFAYRPTEALEEYVRTNKFRDHEFGERMTHVALCGLRSRDPSCSSADNMNAIQRLGNALWAVKLSQGDLEGSGVADDINRYLFTWPPFCTKGFIQQVRDNNPTSLCILLYYYAAIVGILSEKTWWMKDRAWFMYPMLLQKLEGRCEECIAPARELAGENGRLMGF